MSEEECLGDDRIEDDYLEWAQNRFDPARMSVAELQAFNSTHFW